jgi:hypothetical protein
VKEHRHGKFATGQRPRDHDSGDLKGMNGVGIHEFAMKYHRNPASPQVA